MSIHNGWQPMVTIRTTPLPEPSSYEANTATLVDSARNAAGKVVGSVIRNDVAKVSLSWNFISAAEWANILSLFTNNFYNPVTFFNQSTNSWVTRTMYISDRSASVFKRNTNGTIKGYTGASLSLIEV